MNAQQFDVIAKLISSREPTKSAARRVLVDGIGNSEAAAECGISQQSVWNTLRRFRDANITISVAYKLKNNL